MYESIIYTLTAIILYLLSDWLLQTFEVRSGRRFEHRNLIFFAIITILAVSSFALFKTLLVNQ